MNVLLSIKPTFAKRILNNEKKYEFRKTLFRKTYEINKIYLYASDPTRKITGAFTIDNVYENSPESLWNNFGSKSGIEDKNFFMDYFQDSEKGYAIEIDEAYRLNEEVDPRKHLDDFNPPVSFQYINGELQHILERNLPNSIPGGRPKSFAEYSDD